ncbi:MAG: hypothetical protein A2X05_02565 [Bacteroidetes bacterium GWE2_41_25]|nr:MAG: hypothetical protein A2X03_15210 [Bacteroidetes bacterium GWA2_40_15]OFX96743.1 MAG: hypothetical protein A2X06_11250 [Bacteroidetes bacterium GWC2_40_22]OFY12262.1 MAG: hypothetical protein A2X05_02565 [Bacteroidetes bacterium GWE2_41_25]OFY60664.1 MAG: hypothetical protein A2X04_13065 [Bacteroidetes bacterium GWF2_41_9]HAM09133.1 protein-disulfide isomerase [Bacteroidales bacterium]
MKRTLLSFIIIVMVYSSGKSQSDSTTLTKTGDMAPAFKCRTIDGKSLDISKLKGKVIMLNFFATWCPPCNLELPVLQKKIWEKHGTDPDFVLIILGREHSEKEIRDFVTKKNFTMPFAPDPKREVFSLYATQNIPRNVIIGKDGRILYQSTGFSEEQFTIIEELVSEQLR